MDSTEHTISDNPSNSKRGAVCIYYSNYLTLRVIDINYLNEYIVFDIECFSYGNQHLHIKHKNNSQLAP